MTETPNATGQDALPRTFRESAIALLGHEPTGRDAAQYWRTYRKELMVMRQCARVVVESTTGEDNPVFIGSHVRGAMDVLEEQREKTERAGWDYHVIKCAVLWPEETE